MNGSVLPKQPYNLSSLWPDGAVTIKELAVFGRTASSPTERLGCLACQAFTALAACRTPAHDRTTASQTPSPMDMLEIGRLRLTPTPSVHLEPVAAHFRCVAQGIRRALEHDLAVTHDVDAL